MPDRPRLKPGPAPDETRFADERARDPDLRRDRTLAEFVNERSGYVDDARSKLRDAPDQVQRNLIPFAKAGPRGILDLIGDGNITPEYIDLLALFDALFPVNSLRDLLSGPYPTYTVSNYTELRTLDANTATVTDLINFMCTLVADLKTTGPLEE